MARLVPTPVGGTLVPTPVGVALVELTPAPSARALLVLGSGAGGDRHAPDLAALAAALPLDRIAVARVEQPYRVAGRRAPAPPAQLDAAFITVASAARAESGLAAVPLVVGGRSSGARVACRTAGQLGARAVLALAFPLHPPGRPERTRLPELLAAGVPVHVVQGERDAFGRPGEYPTTVDVVPVPGDHSLRAGIDAVVVEVRRWFDALVPR